MTDYLSIFPSAQRQDRTRRLGTVDKLAIQLYQDILELLDKDYWLDRIEEAVVETSATDFGDLSDEKLQDEYFGQLDRMEQRVLTRACQAVINKAKGLPDRVITEAERAENPAVDAG